MFLFEVNVASLERVLFLWDMGASEILVFLLLYRSNDRCFWKEIYMESNFGLLRLKLEIVWKCLAVTTDKRQREKSYRNKFNVLQSFFLIFYASQKYLGESIMFGGTMLFPLWNRDLIWYVCSTRYFPFPKSLKIACGNMSKLVYLGYTCYGILLFIEN